MLSRILRVFLESQRTYKLPRDELGRLQLRKLRRTLRAAYGSVPLYRSWFEESGKTPEDIRTLGDLKALPTLSKGEMVRNYPERMLSRGIRAEVVKRGSGTSGMSAEVPQSGEALDVRHALRLRSMWRAGVKPWSRIVTIWSPVAYWRRQPDERGELRPSTTMYEYPIWILGRPPPTVKILRARQNDPAEDARALARLRPEFLFGRPSHLRRVARELEGQGLSMHAKGVFPGNEVMTPTCAREIEGAFHARAFSGYGSAELGGVVCHCLHRGAPHLNEDYMIFEVLKDGEEAGPGEVGELVATTLHNDLMPLVRYRTGDFVELAEEGRCDCGSSLRVLEAVQGRAKDWVATAGGERVRPLDVAEYVESRFGLTDYQLVQEKVDEVTLRLPKEEVGNEALLRQLGEYLEGVVGAPVRLRVEERPQDELWQKARPVVCRVA